MSSQKRSKRSYGVSEEDDEDDPRLLTADTMDRDRDSYQQAKRRRQQQQSSGTSTYQSSTAGAASTTSGGSSKCRTWLKAYDNASLESINQQFQQAIAEMKPSDDDHPNNFVNLVNECRRATAETECRYGTQTGLVVAFGSNEASQLGLVEMIGKEVDDNFHLPQLVKCLKNNNIRKVEAGGLHCMALSADGVPYTWGSSDDGCLGRSISKTDGEVDEATPTPVIGFVPRHDRLTNEDEMIIAIAAGNTHCLFLSSTGQLYQSGMYKDSDSGKFADLEEPTSSPLGCNDVPVHVQMPGGKKVSQIYTGQDSAFNAALLNDGTLVTWGFGNCGELGRSADMVQPNPKKPGNYDVGRDSYVSEVDDKKTYDFALLREKFLTPAPVRFAGGIMSKMPTMKKTVISVGCGENHLLVAARDPGSFESQVYSCGLNSFGQLGNGKFVSLADYDRDPTLPFMVHELTKVKALEKENITQVAAGAKHSLALSICGKYLFAWGKADEGQLGLGYKKSTSESQPLPQIVEFPRNTDNSAAPVQPLLKSSISAGANHSMAVTVDGDLYTWGMDFGCRVTGHPVPDDQHIYRPTKLDLLQSVSSEQSGGRNYKAVQPLQAAGGSLSSLVLVQRCT